MRTVDPELWSSELQKRRIQASRRLKFGQLPAGRLEARLRESFRDAVADFWHHSSLAAAKHIRMDCMNLTHARWRHFVPLALTLILGLVLVSLHHVQLLKSPPLIVSLQSSEASISDLNFPAVALCSNKVISKAMLEQYASFLYLHPKNKVYRFRKSEIEQNLRNLGALLTLALPPLTAAFDMFLWDVNSNFNVTDIMFMLSGNCSSVLKRCSWRGQVEDCSSLFAPRLTALGFCCVFNSRYQPTDLNREPAVLDMVGQDYGLGVVIREERDDFAYVRRPAYGMELLIFDGDEYPLLESGDVRMYPLPRNASIYFTLRAFTQLPATDEISYYSEERRGCRLWGGGMSSCLSQCRRATAAALCGCVPFALQPQFVAPQVPTCTLYELGCLNKHREKFMYVYPGQRDDPELSQEMQNALDCPDCRVLCKRQLFSAEASYSFYSTKTSIFRNFLSEGLVMVNASVVRLFYNIEHLEWHKVEANMRWYEICVRLGTQWLVLTGISFLNYSELVYHCTIRWVHHFIRRTKIANMLPVPTSM